MKNKHLHTAKRGKNDEFYTQMCDIEKELQHYDFTDKVVYCNCDNEDSNFVKYFLDNYHKLGLKGLLFSGMPNTDFRSPESIDYLKEADVIVTNPPFSLFREYVAQLVEYDKKFLILGNMNAITYKEIFPLIKDNKLWLGTSSNKSLKFNVPEDYPLKGSNCGINNKGVKYITVPAISWFTNLEHNKRNEEIILYKNYTPEEYPTYDNYDAINVDKVKEIPCDYYKVMGVPITFLDKFNPNQFEILGITDRQNTSNLRTKKYNIEDSPKFNDLNARSTLKIENKYKQLYARILIRNK